MVSKWSLSIRLRHALTANTLWIFNLDHEINPHPEFHQEESVLRPFLIQLFEPTLLLGELVVDLPDVHSLEERVAVGGVGLSYVDKQMFAVLRRGETERQRD